MKNLILVIILLWSVQFSKAQGDKTFVPNYDEANMPAYTLPDPLVFANGKPVKNRTEWTKRRSELISFFEKEMFGKVPKWNGTIRSKVLSTKVGALDGLAIRKEIQVDFVVGNQCVSAIVLMYHPVEKKKFPLFLGYNFDGNQSTTSEKDVLLPHSWVSNNKNLGITDNRANEASRGSDISAWPMKEIVSRGFAVATLYYGDIDPDYDDHFKNGIHQLFDTPRDSSSWGSIATWSWALSRVADCLIKDPNVDSKKMIVIGHSRLGKTALWAGVMDPRFSLVVSNNSGCGGAALSKRIYGETVGRINRAFPHWFNERFKIYNENEAQLPFDQHELLALIAPRPLYVASAEDDRWADPKGEFLSCVFASPVYQLLGRRGITVSVQPPLNTPITDGYIAYHIRPGKHAITLYDWQCYMNYADKILGRVNTK